MTLPVKALCDIEVKECVSCSDKILILDSDTDEARLACKDEIKGDKGDQGDPGQAATVSVGTTCTLAPGSSACVSNSGSSSAAVFNFGIPKGEKGDQGNPGAAATVSVGSTTTLDAGCCATVTNSGTSCAAVFNFGVPKGAKGDPGCNGNDGASICAAAFSGDDIVFTKDDSCTVTLSGAKTCLKGDQGVPGCNGCNGTNGCNGQDGNGITCVTTSKSGKTTTVTMNYCTGDPTVFCVQDGADGAGSGDMCTNTYDPTNKMADAFDYCNFTNTPTIPTDNCQLANSCGYTTCTGTITEVCMNGASCGTSGVINLGTVVTDISGKQDTLTAGANVSIVSNKICADNYFIVKESDACTTYTGEKGVAPYNTSYCYTNICINPDSGVVWKEGAIYSFDIDTGMIATSACRNVRVKIGSGEYIPVMGTSSILAGSTYFTKANIRQYQYSTKYQSCGALHLFTDNNTTYSAMSNTEATTGTCTSGRSIAACTLKCAINYYAPISDTAYGSSWDGKTTTAPSQNAVYDKIEAVVCAIPTDNCQLANSCGYTTCTGTISNCTGIISALGYTPYNCTNPAGYTTCTGTLTAETVVSGDTGCTYTIKVGNSEPGAGTPATTITFVTA